MPRRWQNWENKDLAPQVTFSPLVYPLIAQFGPPDLPFLKVTWRPQLHFSSRPLEKQQNQKSQGQGCLRTSCID